MQPQAARLQQPRPALLVPPKLMQAPQPAVPMEVGLLLLRLPPRADGSPPGIWAFKYLLVRFKARAPRVCSMTFSTTVISQLGDSLKASDGARLAEPSVRVRH